MGNKVRPRWGGSLALVALGIMAIGIAAGKGSCLWRRDDSSSSGSSGLLAAPSYLTATLASATQVNLDWTDNSNTEFGFSIERKIGVAAYAEIATVGANITIYSDTGLTESTTFYYRVKTTGYNPAADSAYSNEVSIATSLAGTWTASSLANAPISRANHTAVWTGTLMIIWGGWNGASYYDTGANYTPPVADTWAAVNTTNTPASRTGHTALWATGENKMLVWGGSNSTDSFNSGGLYDPPGVDTWTVITTTDAPASRTNHTAVWTGTRMIIWGGSDLATGGMYDPTGDVWDTSKTNLIVGTDAPSARSSHVAVWTGSLMVVWGGVNGGSSYLSDGGRYNPVLDQWQAITTSGAPSARTNHTALWDSTNDKLIIWGGNNGVSYLNDGGIYDPVADTWTAITTLSAPTGRSFHTAVWTGSQMIVWGGYDGASALNNGGMYNPTTNAWTPTSAASLLPARFDHSAIWTGSNMIIWGGTTGLTYFNTGAVYELAP